MHLQNKCGFLSIFKAKMRRNCIELFRIKMGLLVPIFFVIVVAVRSFVNSVVTVTLDFPDVQMGKCHEMPWQGYISFYSFFLSLFFSQRKDEQKHRYSKHGSSSVSLNGLRKKKEQKNFQNGFSDYKCSNSYMVRQIHLISELKNILSSLY